MYYLLTLITLNHGIKPSHAKESSEAELHDLLTAATLHSSRGCHSQSHHTQPAQLDMAALPSQDTTCEAIHDTSNLKSIPALWQACFHEREVSLDQITHFFYHKEELLNASIKHHFLPEKSYCNLKLLFNHFAPNKLNGIQKPKTKDHNNMIIIPGTCLRTKPVRKP